MPDRISLSKSRATGVAALCAAAFAVAYEEPRAATPTVTGGYNHTCVLQADGKVKCFGTNLYGQLGIFVNAGNSNRNPTPTTVPLAATAIGVGAGGSHTCAVLSNDSTYCFGLNDSGQIGNGATTGTGAHPAPIEVELETPGVNVRAGDFFTCVLDEGSNLACFGVNNVGQLASTTNNNSLTPNPTPALGTVGGPVVAVDGGSSHTCVVLQNTNVRCFGYNYSGQLGTATNVLGDNPNPTPVAVDLGAAAADVSAGAFHTCGLRVDGTVKCFGANDRGQLGTNAAALANPDPGTVALGQGAIQIAAGGLHTCALLVDRSVKCWGSNEYGQLARSEGNGTSTAFPVPTTVGLGAGAVSIGAGFNHTCAILETGAVSCWGGNQGGQLGNTAASYNYTPTVISGLSLFTPAPPGGGGLPSPVAPAGPLKVKIAKPRFKSQLKRGKVRLTSTVKVSATGLSAASCGGRLNATAKIGRKSVAKKSFPFKFSGGACAAKLNLAIAKQYDGKKAALALTISSVLVTAPQLKASVRL